MCVYLCVCVCDHMLRPTIEEEPDLTFLSSLISSFFFNSVSSAVGILPLSLVYGFDACEQFLAGARNIDDHFATAPLRENIPVLMGLLGLWNSSFLGHESRAILPYAQALLRFPAHVQQLDMESNGKRVDVDGRWVSVCVFMRVCLCVCVLVHVQQLDMESNGKRVDVDGRWVRK